MKGIQKAIVQVVQQQSYNKGPWGQRALKLSGESRAMGEDYGKLHRGGDTLVSLEGYIGAQQLDQ